MEETQVVTQAEAYAYLGIDFDDPHTKTTVTNLICAADLYLQGGIGRQYPRQDARAKQLALIIISDLYDNRGMTEKVSGNVRRLVNDFNMQLRAEMRGGSVPAGYHSNTVR